MRNIDKLKNELKELAQQIVVAKQERKTVNFSGERTIKSTRSWYSDAEVACELAIELKKEFRHKHIAYCMLRGTKLEDIEPQTRPAESYERNYRDMNYVNKIMEEYAWSPEEEEAYLARQETVAQVA